MVRRTHHKHAFRRLCADQGPWANDATYRLAEMWCGDTSLIGMAETPERATLADCPKCAAALGAAKLASIRATGLAVELEPIAELKECKDYSLRYARSAYRLMIAGELRGYIIAEAGFGKGWRLRTVAGALAFARHSEGETGDCLSGDRPSRYGYGRDADAHFAPIHFAARDAMAVAAVRAFERGELPTPAEQEARAAERKARQAAEAAERDAARAANEARRERERLALLEDKATARNALEELRKRSDLTNLELAGLAILERLAGVE